MTYTDNGNNFIMDVVKDSVNALGKLFTSHHKELLEKLETPTPQKFSFSVTADAGGLIGGGLANPSPVTIFQCPMSQEVWIHRLAISSPSGTPKTPLTAGQAYLVDGSGSLLYFLPISGSIAPVQITEGFASAVHLNSGSRLSIVGDSFTAGTLLRFDLQMIFATGESQYTPLKHPSHNTAIIL